MWYMVLLGNNLPAISHVTLCCYDCLLLLYCGGSFEQWQQPPYVTIAATAPASYW